VLLVFPILIHFGAGAVEHRPQIGKVLGDASYAIYAVHRPLLAILVWPLVLDRQPPQLLRYSVEAALIIVIGALAWLINRGLASRKAS
jgi:peptidoglycan/LPS O-acetylase OafA/YrhL